MIAAMRAAGVVAVCKADSEVAAEFLQKMSHGGEDQLFLAAKVMMRERRRYARLMGNLRDSHIKRAALADGADSSIDQLPLAQWFHSDFGHVEKPRLLGICYY